MLARAWDSDLVYSFRASPVAMASAALLGLILVIAAVFAPWLAPHDPMDLASLSLLDSFKPPIGMADADWSNPLGTDNQGRDVLSAIMYGMRISLLVGFLSVLFAIVVGVAIGLLAGYAGGIVDTVLMRIADVQLTFPSILTALLVDGVIGAALPDTMRDGAADPRHHLRHRHQPVARLRPHRPRLHAGRAQQGLRPGRARDRRAVVAHHGHHVLPNVIGPVMVIGTLGLGSAVITEATLSFLGVGLPPTQPSLGTLIRFGNDFLFSGQWWVTSFPASRWC